VTDWMKCDTDDCNRLDPAVGYQIKFPCLFGQCVDWGAPSYQIFGDDGPKGKCIAGEEAIEGRLPDGDAPQPGMPGPELCADVSVGMQGNGVASIYRNELIGQVDEGECGKAVREAKPRANAASWVSVGGGKVDCYAEFNVDEPIAGPADRSICLFMLDWACYGYQRGDAAGSGGEVYVGSANSEIECMLLTRISEPGASGITWNQVSLSCYADHGYPDPAANYMTGLSDYVTCGFISLGNRLVHANTEVIHYDRTRGAMTLVGEPMWEHIPSPLSMLCKDVAKSVDGSGSKELHIGKVAQNTCAQVVRTKHPRANGATWTDGGECYAEFGQTGTVASQDYFSNCQFLVPWTVHSFGWGDIQSASEVLLENTLDAADPVLECMLQVKAKFPRATGFATGQSGECYAENGAITGVNRDSTVYRSGFFHDSVERYGYPAYSSSSDVEAVVAANLKPADEW